MAYIVLPYKDGKGWLCVNENSFKPDYTIVSLLRRATINNVATFSLQKKDEELKITKPDLAKLLFNSPFELLNRLGKTVNNKVELQGDGTYKVGTIKVQIHTSIPEGGAAWKFKIV